MNIKCMIVDDEPLAVRLLTHYVSRVHYLTLHTACLNAVEAVSLLEKESVDLLFLDIRMPDISGITLLKNLVNPPLVIFTTAYQEYALDGFDLNVMDYLLKPIEFARFMSSVNRSKEYLSITKQQVVHPAFADFIFVKSEFKIMKLMYSDILYLEGLKDYTKIYVKGKAKPVLTLQSLKTFELKLPVNLFVPDRH